MKLIINDSLASVLKITRIRHGIKQKDLANKMGVSSMYLSYLENEKRPLKLDIVEKWADALDLELGITLEKKK